MRTFLLSAFFVLFSFPADCFAQLFMAKDLYKLYKKIPVVCWHKEWDERFELEIEASFVSPAETMDIYTLKDDVPGVDTAFVWSNIRGLEFSVLEYQYCLNNSLDDAAMDSVNRKVNVMRRLMCNTDSIFIVRIMDDIGNFEHFYQYFGVKRNGHYEYGRTDFGPDTWTFPEMIEKAFGSMENFRKQYLEYVERVLYGRPKPVPEVPDDGKPSITVCR